MSMQDTLADMLTRIRNAQMAGHLHVKVLASKMNAAVAKVLLDEGYIASVNNEKEGVRSSLVIELKYTANGKPVIEKLKRISRPSLRSYVSASNLPKVNAGLGVAIISTNKGVMADQAARKANVGGEVICTVF